MRLRWSLLLAVLASSLVLVCEGSEGDDRPRYRACVQGCEKTGCVDGQCYNSCNFPVNVDLEGNILPKKALNSAHEKFLEEPLYLRWKKWDCISECRYQCMVWKELAREAGAEAPVKYHGKWPFIRIFSLQFRRGCLIFARVSVSQEVASWQEGVFGKFIRESNRRLNQIFRCMTFVGRSAGRVVKLPLLERTGISAMAGGIAGGFTK